MEQVSNSIEIQWKSDSYHHNGYRRYSASVNGIEIAHISRMEDERKWSQYYYYYDCKLPLKHSSENKLFTSGTHWDLNSAKAAVELIWNEFRKKFDLISPEK